MISSEVLKYLSVKNIDILQQLVSCLSTSAYCILLIQVFVVNVTVKRVDLRGRS
jgi:hypothetical protein